MQPYTSPTHFFTTATRYLSHLKKNSLLLRGVYLAAGILALTGVLDSVVNGLGYGQVLSGTDHILQSSMKNAAITTMLLTSIKGVLAMISSVEVSILVISGNFGALLEGFSELVNIALRFFLTMTGVMVAKISFIQIIQLMGLSVFAGSGFILLAMDPWIRTFIGRVGKIILSIGVVMYFVFPTMITVVGVAFESHKVSSEITYSENVAIMSQRAEEITFSSLRSEDGRAQALSLLSDGMTTLWEGLLNVFVSYLLMFLILPFASLGLCYLIIKQSLMDNGFHDQVKLLQGQEENMSGFIKGPRHVKNSGNLPTSHNNPDSNNGGTA